MNDLKNKIGKVTGKGNWGFTILDVRSRIEYLKTGWVDGAEFVPLDLIDE